MASLALSALLALFSLGALELIFRLFRPQLPSIVSSNTETFRVNDPRIGRVLRPNAHYVVSAAEFTTEYQVSSQGLRDRVVHAVPKPSGISRILLLGDSFTFGVGVDYEAIWPVVFERRLRELGYRVDVVKAGVPAQDTLNELLYLKYLAPRFEPDFVVIVFLPNDLVSNRSVDDADVLREARRDSLLQSLHLIEFVKGVVKRSDYLHARLYLSTPWSRFYLSPAEESAKRQMEVTGRLLAQAFDYCRRRNIHFAALSVPEHVQVIIRSQNYDLPNFDVEAVDRELGRLAASKGFPWIAALDHLARVRTATGKRLYFPSDGHLNEEGNAVLGEWFTRQFVRLFNDLPRDRQRRDYPNGDSKPPPDH